MKSFLANKTSRVAALLQRFSDVASMQDVAEHAICNRTAPDWLTCDQHAEPRLAELGAPALAQAQHAALRAAHAFLLLPQHRLLIGVCPAASMPTRVSQRCILSTVSDCAYYMLGLFG